MADNNKIRILNLVRWYPNRYDPMPGLFIQRHIEASAKYCKPAVVYTHQVEEGWSSEDNYDLNFKNLNGVPTVKIYYKASVNWFKPYRKLINIIRFFKANKIGISQIKKEINGFNIIHVHILTRLGIIALYYKYFHKIPYIITEHWSRYLDLTGAYKGFFRRITTKKVVRNASFVTAVTSNLAVSMQKHGLINNQYVILPNVVDDAFLSAKLESNVSAKTNFIHISCFEDKSKNISGLLRVIKQLSIKRNDFTFTMVGDGMDYKSLRELSDKLEISKNIIRYTGLLEGEELVKELSRSDYLVIFSNYENFPVVINESLSMGVPVIATSVGGIPERINQTNGILVNPGDENDLIRALNDVLDNPDKFNNSIIRERHNSEFSPDTIGKQIFDLYLKADM